MRDNKLVFGIIIGAVVGGMATLFDQETRNITKTQFKCAKSKTNYYLKHPSEAINKARVACNQFNNTFNSSAESAINALEQVEETIDKITMKDQDPKRIESTE